MIGNPEKIIRSSCMGIVIIVTVGADEGIDVGILVGDTDGSPEGDILGGNDGWCDDGVKVGWSEGDMEG